MFNTFYTLSPKISQQYGPRLQVIFRQHIQPWHPSSTLTHEAGAAVLRLAPEKFWDFSSALFKRQTEFFDVSLVNETRNKTYERLAKVAGSVGLDESKVLDLLKVSESPGEDGQLNVGNQVTNDIKLMVKVGNPGSSLCIDPLTLPGGSSGGRSCLTDRFLQRKRNDTWKMVSNILIFNVGRGRAEHQQQFHGSSMGRMACPERGLTSITPVGVSRMSCISCSFFLLSVCAYIEPEPSGSEER